MSTTSSSSNKSIVIALTLAGLTFFSTNYFKEILLSSDKGKVFVGFTCSLIYMFLLTTLGNIKLLSGKSSGWFDVIICLIISEIIASTFHGVCITTCFLFSIVITYELFQLSNSDKLSSYDQNVVNEGQRKFSKK